PGGPSAARSRDGTAAVAGAHDAAAAAPCLPHRRLTGLRRGSAAEPRQERDRRVKEGAGSGVDSGVHIDPSRRARAARSAQDDSTGRLDKKEDRKSTRLNSSHLGISYAVFCLKKKKHKEKK